MTRTRFSLVLTLALAGAATSAMAAEIASGPMVGYSQMREVMLWVQTDGPAKVAIRYWEQDDPTVSYFTDAVTTEKANAYVAKLLADRVEPSRTYRYDVILDGKKVELPYPRHFQTQQLWQFRTNPPNFKVALGSCFYGNEPEYDRPGDPYGGQYEILSAIDAERPDVMIWLGDNTYLREVDWHSRTGMLKRYSHDRAVPEMQRLLAATHHYAIWDDHDAGPNNTNRSQWNIDQARDVFELFWANPSTGVPSVPDGITTYFQWGDIDFFLLDNRSFRSPNQRRTGKRTILGDQQVEWIVDALATSRAPFKMVAIGGQVLNPVAAFENYVNVAPAERARLLDALRAERITGVVFLSGDRHHTEASMLDERGFPKILELTFSPLTSGSYAAAVDEPNYLRLPDTITVERNFGLLAFSGPRGDRTMGINCFGAEGGPRWKFSVHEDDLKGLPNRD